MTSYLVRLAQQLLWLPLCLIGLIYPRNEKLWVFGAWHGRQYSDNTCYLYRYVRDNVPELRAVWLSRDPQLVDQVRAEGGEAALAYSLRGILISLRAGVFLVTHSSEDVNAHASLGGRLINLTHGTPLKRFGRDARSTRIGKLTVFFDQYLRRILPGKRRPDQVLVASEVGRLRMISAFGLPPERVKAFGFPRWNAFRANAAELLSREGIEASDYKGILLYAPTLRMQGKGRLDVAQGDRLMSLLGWLEQNRLLLLIRGHTSLNMVGVEELVRSSLSIREVPITRIPDVNALLPAIDILITDYSSLMFDYACLKRPIILMAPDLDEYQHRDVGIYGDYLHDSPGPVISYWSQLPEAWEDIQKGEYDAKLENFLNKHGVLYDDHVCNRIMNHLRA
ncbi:CDP-glycerol glycerophosphotransferase family protein [Halomonas sp. M5N1S17]|uniref:CDP-glycerol glycerophosphotransferase family protein n=1 Tax=Halomonas alkalisoli TaxID=2907158 RepID=UPI001F176F97|nr:CDP-glycerol glycerophosphotransferase family protein [Halomonas alkalisoli]MCE9662752.1 CDP-glycerol glycerophosphotransferase family protein [Halomonas alkalisoli]